MGSGSNCICGQLFVGQFQEFLGDDSDEDQCDDGFEFWTEMSGKDPKFFGFDYSMQWPEYRLLKHNKTFELMAEMWIAEINFRRVFDEYLSKDRAFLNEI